MLESLQSSTPASLAALPVYTSIPTFMSMTGLSRRVVYERLGTGELRAIKAGTRTLIDVAHGLAWLRSLPPARIRPTAPRAAA